MSLAIITRLGRTNVVATISRSVCARYMATGGEGHRKNCILLTKPKCDKETLENSECMAKKKEAAKKPKNPFKSMWENPDCCMDPCPDVLPRFDELYWSISDKAKREYMQTWVECPPIRVVPKKVCCFEPGKLPPLPRRPKNQCPPTARKYEECDTESDINCKKVQSPGCKKARNPPKCKRERRPSDCRKVCTPYPAYSECKKDRKRPLHPIECLCLRIPAMCEVWEAKRQMDSNKK